MSPIAPMIPIGLLLLLGAPTSPVELSWSAPDRCPGRAEAIAKIEALLGHGLSSPAGVERVEATIEDRAVLRLSLVFRGVDGDQARAIEDSDCGALAEAAALIIAIALDPEAMGEPPPPAPRRPRTGLDAPGIPFEIPYPRIGLGAYGGGDLSLGPIGGDLALSGAVLWSLFRFELLVQRAFARAAAGGSSALWSASAVACLDPLGGELEAPICLGLNGVLDEITPNGQATRRAVAGGPALSASLLWAPAPLLGLRARIEAALPFGRQPGPDGGELPALTGALLFGAEVRFP